MEFTGERFVPGTIGNIELEHLHRYLLAQRLCAGRTVLDIASGEGYGSALLAEQAARVVGVDVAPDAVAHAQTRYARENLTYTVGDCAEIPFPDAQFDAVVSFETIEHHDRHEEMMAEIKRVLRPDGFLLISSPDKKNFSPDPDCQNPYHVKELHAEEFKTLLETYFKNTVYFGQRVLYGSTILPQNQGAQPLTFWKQDDRFEHAPGVPRPIYWLGLASDHALPTLHSGIFEQSLQETEPFRQILQERNHAWEMNAALQRTIDEKEKEISSLLNSKSWRLTSPLRFAARLCRHI